MDSMAASAGTAKVTPTTAKRASKAPVRTHAGTRPSRRLPRSVDPISTDIRLFIELLLLQPTGSPFPYSLSLFLRWYRGIVSAKRKTYLALLNVRNFS